MAVPAFLGWICQRWRKERKSLLTLVGSGVRLSRTSTRSSESVLGDPYQTLAEPVVLELVPVGG